MPLDKKVLFGLISATLIPFCQGKLVQSYFMFPWVFFHRNFGVTALDLFSLLSRESKFETSIKPLWVHMHSPWVTAKHKRKYEKKTVMVSLEKVPMFPQHIFVSLVLFLSHPSGVATAAFFFMPLLVFCLLSSFVKRINLGKKKLLGTKKSCRPLLSKGLHAAAQGWLDLGTWSSLYIMKKTANCVVSRWSETRPCENKHTTYYISDN